MIIAKQLPMTLLLNISFDSFDFDKYIFFC